VLRLTAGSCTLCQSSLVETARGRSAAYQQAPTVAAFRSSATDLRETSGPFCAVRAPFAVSVVWELTPVGGVGMLPFHASQDKEGNHRCGGRALVGYIAVRRPLTLEVWRVFSPVVAPSRRCWPGATCRCKQPAGRGHARPGTITMCTHHRLFYDGNEVANISNRAGYNDYDPQNSASGLVVWSGRVEKDWEIFLWDGKQIEGADIL
jgi:hypothetical protein